MSRETKIAAVVYCWDEAPEELRALSDHGGDEDWVVVLNDPSCYSPFDVSDNDYVPGWGNVGRYEIEGTDLSVIIFAHA